MKNIHYRYIIPMLVVCLAIIAIIYYGFCGVYLLRDDSLILIIMYYMLVLLFLGVFIFVEHLLVKKLIGEKI